MNWSWMSRGTIRKTQTVTVVVGQEKESRWLDLADKLVDKWAVLLVPSFNPLKVCEVVIKKTSCSTPCPLCCRLLATQMCTTSCLQGDSEIWLYVWSHFVTKILLLKEIWYHWKGNPSNYNNRTGWPFNGASSSHPPVLQMIIQNFPHCNCIVRGRTILLE